mmetsp:Transcript_8567/g.34609  ORF Transcript_8567/g.34609 Transcript_8567/m.34609 type:complete len:267 (-) Transcript_8567:192-992(-)
MSQSRPRRSSRCSSPPRTARSPRRRSTAARVQGVGVERVRGHVTSPIAFACGVSTWRTRPPRVSSSSRRRCGRISRCCTRRGTSPGRRRCARGRRARSVSTCRRRRGEGRRGSSTRAALSVGLLQVFLTKRYKLSNRSMVVSRRRGVHLGGSHQHATRPGLPAHRPNLGRRPQHVRYPRVEQRQRHRAAVPIPGPSLDPLDPAVPPRHLGHVVVRRARHPVPLQRHQPARHPPILVRGRAQVHHVPARERERPRRDPVQEHQARRG